jgi:hypothetical protein
MKAEWEPVTPKEKKRIETEEEIERQVGSINKI